MSDTRFEFTVSGKGRRWLERGHPWVYRDDLQRGTRGDVEPGALVHVRDAKGEHIGWGLASPASRIAARLVSREAEPPGDDFWKQRVQQALARRERLGYLDPEGACRLIAGDAEGFPGWVADRYRDVLVVQSGTAAADVWRDAWVSELRASLPFEVNVVLDRSDAAVRRYENLPERVEYLHGEACGPVPVREGDLIYEVDVERGHKTGHYLDQRENRIAATADCEGSRVLDAFSYDGLFGIRAALGGAREVLCLDQSADAGERVLRNAERNGVANRVRFEKVDCMQDLRARAQNGESFDLIGCDPPPFARNRREAQGAERGYVELNRRALELLNPEGLLVTSSCSYNVRTQDFVHYLSRASNLAARPTYLEQVCGAAPDHPVLLTLPESSYLKCAFVRAT